MGSICYLRCSLFGRLEGRPLTFCLVVTLLVFPHSVYPCSTCWVMKFLKKKAVRGTLCWMPNTQECSIFPTRTSHTTTLSCSMCLWFGIDVRFRGLLQGLRMIGVLLSSSHARQTIKAASLLQDESNCPSVDTHMSKQRFL